MPRKEKEETVARLEDVLLRCRLAIFTDYRGMSAPEMTRLRQLLRGRGVEFRVVKNTLTHLALERLGQRGEGLLEGPTAIAFGFGEEGETARAVAEYLKVATSLRLKGGLMGDRRLNPEELHFLATLPPIAELRAKAVGGMKAPLGRLVSALTNPLGRLLAVLQARQRQLEGG